MSLFSNHPFLHKTFLPNAAAILEEYDTAVARASGKKHFILIYHNTSMTQVGKAYEIYFRPVDDPVVNKLNPDQKMAVINSQHDQSICILYVSANGNLLTAKYERKVL